MNLQLIHPQRLSNLLYMISFFIILYHRVLFHSIPNLLLKIHSLSFRNALALMIFFSLSLQSLTVADRNVIETEASAIALRAKIKSFDYQKCLVIKYQIVTFKQITKLTTLIQIAVLGRMYVCI